MKVFTMLYKINEWCDGTPAIIEFIKEELTELPKLFEKAAEMVDAIKGLRIFGNLTVYVVDQVPQNVIDVYDMNYDAEWVLLPDDIEFTGKETVLSFYQIEGDYYSIYAILDDGKGIAETYDALPLIEHLQGYWREGIYDLRD